MDNRLTEQEREIYKIIQGQGNSGCHYEHILGAMRNPPDTGDRVAAEDVGSSLRYLEQRKLIRVQKKPRPTTYYVV